MPPDAPKPSGYLVDAAPAGDDKAALREKTATLSIDYAAPNGTQFRGEFTNRILNAGQRVAVDLARAKAAGGVPPEAMSRHGYALLYAICWLKESIVAGPDWTKNLADSMYEGLVGELWAQVDSHERTFFGGNTHQSEGQG